jgi:lipopolysaccharide export system permease protein
MTWLEIHDEIDKLHQDKEHLLDDIASHQAVINTGVWPSHFEKHVRDQRHRVRQLDNLSRLMVTELHMRPALALGCLCFVLVGCPVGIWFSRNDYLSAFITCFLPIVVLYYPLMLCGINLAKLGRFNPWVSLWCANVLMAIIAMLLFRKLLRN